MKLWHNSMGCFTSIHKDASNKKSPKQVHENEVILCNQESPKDITTMVNNSHDKLFHRASINSVESFFSCSVGFCLPILASSPGRASYLSVIPLTYMMAWWYFFMAFFHSPDLTSRFPSSFSSLHFSILSELLFGRGLPVDVHSAPLFSFYIINSR